MKNVLFLMADELSWWALGHQNPMVQTPNLDRLAARGLRFDAAYTPAPICVPTRAAIACGKYQHEIGYWSSAEAYDGRVPSWGHRLQQADISVTSIGKLHYQSSQDDTGFDEQIEPIHILNGVGWVQALLRRESVPYDSADRLAQDIGPGRSSYTDYDSKVTAEAVAWLADPARKAGSWGCFVSWLAPHFPLVAPQHFYDLYDPRAFEADGQVPPSHPVLQEIVRFFNHDDYFTPETRGIACASYFALCSFLDAQVGAVLEALEASGMADETLIIFTSDHGEMLGEKGFWTKSVMFDSAVRVPLILAGPSVTAGRTDRPVSLIDIAPTICQYLGIGSGGFSGRDLMGELDPARPILSEFHDGGASVGVTMIRWNTSSTAWKLVYYAEGQPPQLFNLTDDPLEEVDLAATSPTVVEEGVLRLLDFMDPEQVNARAHADQAARVTALGGMEKVRELPIFDYTPARACQV